MSADNADVDFDAFAQNPPSPISSASSWSCLDNEGQEILPPPDFWSARLRDALESSNGISVNEAEPLSEADAAALTTPIVTPVTAPTEAPAASISVVSDAPNHEEERTLLLENDTVAFCIVKTAHAKPQLQKWCKLCKVWVTRSGDNRNKDHVALQSHQDNTRVYCALACAERIKEGTKRLAKSGVTRDQQLALAREMTVADDAARMQRNFVVDGQFCRTCYARIDQIAKARIEALAAYAVSNGSKKRKLVDTRSAAGDRQ